MSEKKEKPGAKKVTDASEESADAVGPINIPVSTDLHDSDFAREDSASESETPSRSHKTPVELQSAQHQESYESLDGDYEALPEEEVVDTSQMAVDSEDVPLMASDAAVQSAPLRPDDHLIVLDKIKSMTETLKASREDSEAKVKVVLLPVAQEIIVSFRVESMLKYLQDYLAGILSIPAEVLKMTCSGKIVKNKETLLQFGVKPQETVQVEISSTNPGLYPIRRVHGLSNGSKCLTVRVAAGVDRFEDVAVEIALCDFHKPFLGGFRHKLTGIEYHNAGTQTVPKKIQEKTGVVCRDTQTVCVRKKLQQTINTTSTQMSTIGVYVSNMSDKLIKPGKYFTAEEYHIQRLAAVIVLQTYYRQWHAKTLVKELKRQKKLRLEWESQEELRKKREKEEWMKMDYYRRHHPKTEEDFELLYNAVELWHQEQREFINQSLTGAERKAALCKLLEQETKIISSIGRRRYIANQDNQEASIQAFLEKCSAPKIWRTGLDKVIEMDTQYTIRARELHNIYKCITLKNISQDERLDVLLTLKHTVKEHECKLTQDILELVDREVDLMMRGVKSCNLEGLRKRITTLFLHYIKTPLFNPEVARYLKVPPDPLKFYRKIHFCHSCQLYLPSTEFAISATAQPVRRCRQCSHLDNEARGRESFLKYKCLLQRLYFSETEYDGDSNVAYLMQLQDIQYLVENIWASQSIISAWDDINDLVMVRWDKTLPWSPWNCILLTKDEALFHLKLPSIEEGYEPLFIHKIKHKHILAKNYFSQTPELASFVLEDEEMHEIRRRYHPDTAPKVLESKRLSA
ncbi:IQ motif and ubiquitin-like domain-containing protein [Rhynchocyon petersi]